MMHLANIIPQFSALTQDEQLNMIKQIRHNKHVLKPDIVKKKKKKLVQALEGEQKKTRSKARTQINRLTDAQRLALIEQLEKEITSQ